jgi:hypothetical protein
MLIYITPICISQIFAKCKRISPSIYLIKKHLSAVNFNNNSMFFTLVWGVASLLLFIYITCQFDLQNSKGCISMKNGTGLGGWLVLKDKGTVFELFFRMYRGKS